MHMRGTTSVRLHHASDFSPTSADFRLRHKPALAQASPPISESVVDAGRPVGLPLSRFTAERAHLAICSCQQHLLAADRRIMGLVLSSVFLYARSAAADAAAGGGSVVAR